MYARMHGLLATAEERRKVLMFVIIMPYWEEAESSDPEELVTFYREESANRVTKRNAWTEIAESQFLSKSLRLEASQHGYMEGAQHAKKNQHRVSSQDTSIFFLQTSKAKRKYPLDESSVQLLVDAFRPITTVETNNTSESSTSKRVVKRKKNTTNTKNDRKKSRFK